MRPFLRRYVYWRVTPEGVLFRGVTTTVQFRGGGLGPWARQLVKLLDGRRPWHDRLKRRPPEAAALLERLLEPLLKAGLVVDLDAEAPHDLTTAEIDRYQTVIDYIGEWVDQPYTRFTQFRRTPVHLICDGLHGASALRALVETGVAQITYQPTDEESALLAERFLAPYADWPVSVQQASDVPDRGTVLWTGQSEAPPSPVLAALGGCRLVHTYLANSVGLPPLEPLSSLEELMVNVQVQGPAQGAPHAQEARRRPPEPAAGRYPEDQRRQGAS